MTSRRRTRIAVSMHMHAVAGLAALLPACSQQPGFGDVRGADAVADIGVPPDAPPDAPAAMDAADARGDTADAAADAGEPVDTGDESRDGASPDGDGGVAGFVYAHSDRDLYRVDALSFALARVGTFTFPGTTGGDMLDIALTRDHELYGVTGDAVWRIAADTAVCTRVTASAGAGTLNALTFLPAASATAPERLVGATEDGRYFEIDRTTGAATEIGAYGLNVGSSGDLVSVAGAGTFATIIGSDGFEYLARINETTGAATPIGRTALNGTWGLGYWAGQVFGFTTNGEFATIDVLTAHATIVARVPGVIFWGAGVQTTAPTSPSHGR